MKRLKFGDIIEISTSKGLSYAIYTHKHDMYGPLIQVFNCVHVHRPLDLSFLATCPVDIICFFPLGPAVNRKIFGVVGHLEIPSSLSMFPIFRGAGRQDFKTGKVFTWVLWDGVKSWDIGGLSAEQKKLPKREIINDTLLIERIEQGWTPETDVMTNR